MTAYREIPETHGETIKNLATGPFKTLLKIKPTGALQARKQANGAVLLYWRYSIGNFSDRVSIGTYDSSAPPKSLQPTSKGYSLAAAIQAAQVLAQSHYDNRAAGGYPALLATQQADKRQSEQLLLEAQIKVDTEKLAATKYNLAALLADYCDYLESLGRRSFSDAISIFRIHVFEAWPKLAATPAKDISADQVADMMRTVIESGKARTANKLRSYLRAAYEVAKASRSKPSIPLRFKAYGVTSNPAADTYPDESANKPDKNPLSAAELRTYWQSIKPMPGLIGAALRLHLLTGGQRIEQLCNLLTANVSTDMVILFDGKGRPGKAPRPHAVPLIEAAAQAMRELNPTGAFAISTDGGKTHLAATTLSHWAAAAGAGIVDFKTKRLRSGVETLLAAARISTDIRGRLQSHGVSGVQARHYDGHDYQDEKRHALETLFNLLEGTTAVVDNVVPLRAAR
jgi:integrase